MDKTRDLSWGIAAVNLRKEDSDKRQLKYKHPQYGPPYTMTDKSGMVEWIDEDEAKKRHWYDEYVKGKK